MEEYKTRMIEEYGDLVKKYYKLKSFLEVERGQRHLEAMDRSLLREQLHYMGGYLEVLSRRIARLFCTPNFESESGAASTINAYPAPTPAPKAKSVKSESEDALTNRYSCKAASDVNEKKSSENNGIKTVSADDFIKWFNKNFN